jgi:hypothetical protein
VNLLFKTLPLVSLAIAALHAQQYKDEHYSFSATSPIIQVDLNGDGIPDFIRNAPSEQELLSSGSGTYTAHTYAQVPGGGPFGTPVAGGDFNGDGKADVVFVQPLGVAYGDGKGGFTSYQEAAANIGFGYAVAQVADFTHDGKPDVAIAYTPEESGFPTYVIILLVNNGHGFNEPVTVYKQGSGPGAGYQSTTPLDLVLGDFDADGKADLVLRTTQTDPNPNNYLGSLLTLTALYGDAAGHFAAKTVLTKTNSPFQIATADMNNDGRSDLVADGSAITIFYGHANRTFTQGTVGTHGAQGNPMLADFDGNFRKDIVYPWTSDQGEIGVSDLLQTGPVVFTQGDFYSTGDTYHPGTGVVPFTQTLVGDYNHDQRPDVALMASGDADRYPNNIHILLNLQGVPDGGCKTPAPVGIAVCLPTTQTASNPVKFSFAANSFYPMRKMEVWVDGVKLSETYKVFANAGFQDVKLTLSAGTHNVDLYAIGFDQEGFRKSLKITVK